MAVKTYKYSDAIKLAEHFNSAEFRCKCDSHCDYKVDEELVVKLEALFTKIPELFDVEVGKIIITSGYRCPSHDRAVGGYGSGPHVDGKAADICVYDKNANPISSKMVCCAAQELGFLGIANITASYIYTHVDVKQRKLSDGTPYKWFGNEVYSDNTVTSDFWTYFGMAKKTNIANPMSIVSYGIDISNHQGDIDFATAAKNTDFVVMRAGYGRLVSQKDERFEKNYAGFKAQGTPIGAYWYCYASDAADAKLEAQACLEVLKGKQFELPIFYDILEDDHQPILRRNGDIATLINEIVPAFCDELEKAGYFVGVYCNTMGYRYYLDDAVKQRYVQWVADWTGVCGYTGDKVLWQYSDKGSVPGITGAVDKDYAYSDFSIIKNGGFNGWPAHTEDHHPDNTAAEPDVEEPVNIEPTDNNTGVVHQQDDPTPDDAISVFEKILKEVAEINEKLGKKTTI